MIPKEIARAHLCVTLHIFIWVVQLEKILTRLFEEVHLVMLKCVNKLFAYLVALLRSEAVVRGRPAFHNIGNSKANREHHSGGGYKCRHTRTADSVFRELLAGADGVGDHIDEYCQAQCNKEPQADYFGYMHGTY